MEARENFLLLHLIFCLFLRFIYPTRSSPLLISFPIFLIAFHYCNSTTSFFKQLFYLFSELFRYWHYQVKELENERWHTGFQAVSRSIVNFAK